MNEPRHPLRVGVILEGPVVPRWIASTVERIEAAGFVDLASIVVAPKRLPADHKISRTAFSAYERLDRLIFRSTTDGFEATDLSGVLSGESSEQDLDVLINLAWPTATASSMRPRFGEWSVHHGGSRTWHSEPPFFWETYHEEPVVISELCVQLAEDDVPRVIYRTVSATDLHSPYRARNQACWKVSAMVLQRLAQLHAQRGSFFESLPAYSEPTAADVPTTQQVPGNLRMIGHVTRLGARLLWSRLRKQLTREEWFLAYRQGTWAEQSKQTTFRLVPPVSGRYFADPFLFGLDGRHYIFFEDLRIREGRGVISYVEIREDGTISTPNVALERDYHLSYPLVFAHEGAVYMVPESSANRTIELYRAEAFPERWVLDHVLMDGVHAVDATLVEHRDRWWMFANMRQHGTEYSDELFLFSSQSLDGDWTPHPLNPIVSDVRRARPAGRIFFHNGALIRPGQDSSRAYGTGVVFSRIDELSETRFRETPISRLGPECLAGSLGTHTYNFDGVYEVVDGRRRRSRFQWGGGA